MHFSFDLRLSLLVTVAEFFLHKLCKFFSNIFYVHLYISVEAALKQSIFSICEFALPENSRRFSGMLFAKKKEKNSFRILVHKARLVLRRAIIKIAAGFILRDAGARLERSICTSSLCASMGPSIRPPGRRSSPYWRILSAETERVQERRRVRSTEDAPWKKKKTTKKSAALPRS